MTYFKHVHQAPCEPDSLPTFARCFRLPVTFVFLFFFLFSRSDGGFHPPLHRPTRGQHLQAGRLNPTVETVRRPVMLRGHEGAGEVRDGRQGHRLHIKKAHH